MIKADFILLMFVGYLLTLFGFNFSVYAAINAVVATAFAGIFGAILFRLLDQVFKRSILSAGLNRFAILGLLAIAPFYFLLFNSTLQQQALEYAPVFLHITQKSGFPDFALIAKSTFWVGAQSVFVAPTVAVVMWLVRNEFISAEAKALECAKLELNAANVMYKQTTLITAYYHLIMLSIFFYFCLSFSISMNWYAVIAASLLLLPAITSVEITSIALVAFIAYLEYINYTNLNANVNDVYTVLLSVNSVIKNLGFWAAFGKIAKVNEAFYLLLAPFYLLLIAQRYSTRSLVAKEMTEEHATATATTPAGVGVVYLGKRIN